MFAPAIGNAHGVYTSAPDLDAQRVTDLVAATASRARCTVAAGMTDEQFHDLIAGGCAKVNISTALKREFMRSSLDFLNWRRRRASGIRRRCSPTCARHRRAHDGLCRDVRQRG